MGRNGSTAAVPPVAKAPAAAGSFSVEQPLWIAVSAFRVLTLFYAIGRYAEHEEHYTNQLGAWIYMGVLTAWTLGTVKVFWSKANCSRRWLAGDLLVIVTGILLTRAFDAHRWVVGGDVTLPTIRAAGTVLGFAMYGGWLPAAIAGVMVGVANIIEATRLTSSNLHNIVLLLLAGVAVGSVVDLARRSEETLARALEIQAATRERERLARDIHDGVLQVLALVKRRGTEMGGEAGEIAALAGEQEAALRALIGEGLSGGPGVTEAPVPAPVRPVSPKGWVAAKRAKDTKDAARAGAEAEQPQDLRALLAPLAGVRVSVAQPATPVLLPARTAEELKSAVAAALDNVRQHVGEQAQAWILVEDEPSGVIVSIRDDGPGFDQARLGEAEQEGRLGVSQSIRGRLRDLGGSAEIFSAPGQGTEVELRVPRLPTQRGPAQRGQLPRAQTQRGQTERGQTERGQTEQGTKEARR